MEANANQPAHVRIVEWLAILCLAAMVAISFTSTAIRYLMPGWGGIYWAEEVTRYTSIWMVFLASGLGVRYGVHLHVDLLTAHLPAPMQRWLAAFCCLLMIAFEGVLIYFGSVVAISNMDQQSSSLLLPMGFMYAAIPVGGVLMLFETGRVLAATIRGRAQQAGPALARQFD
ncbi:MAG: TRAP transporter small permease [Betaproteobacteria bacterium]